MIRSWLAGAAALSVLAAGPAAAAPSQAAAATAGAASRTPDYAALRATLRREIPGMMRASHTVGLSIALVDGQQVVWARGFGLADRATGRRATASTLFHIGSTAKTMTAAAVMQLVQQARVDLDAPLSRYVPEFKMLPRFRGNVITVRSVLDMHSGIPGDILNGLITSHKPYPGFRRYLLRVLAKSYPERPVNSAEAYSNSGYVLLQNLVENVSGQDFATYTREHLFAPMGMPNTTFDDTVPPDRAMATGYHLAPGTGGGVKVHQSPREYINGWATGSVLSSATEMGAYLKTMIASGATPTGQRILGADTFRQMLVPQTELPIDITFYKMGLGRILDDAGSTWMGPAAHWNGGTPTFVTFFRWLPELGLGAFVSVNTPTATASDVGLRALGLMVTAKTGRTAPAPAKPARVVEKAAPRNVGGRYATAPEGLWNLAVKRGALELAQLTSIPGLTSSRPLRLLPRADGWYAAHASSDHPLARLWFKPKAIAGRRLLLAHYPTGVVATFAERLPADYRIPLAWRARTGTYRATNIIAGSTRGSAFEQVAPTVRLRIEHGVLTWNGAIENPSGPRLAFAYGMSTSVARGTGDALVASGDTLTRYGLVYRKVRGG